MARHKLYININYAVLTQRVLHDTIEYHDTFSRYLSWRQSIGIAQHYSRVMWEVGSRHVVWRLKMLWNRPTTTHVGYHTVHCLLNADVLFLAVSRVVLQCAEAKLHQLYIFFF